MPLSALLDGLGVVNVPDDVAITGLSEDSRRLAPGDAFLALRGETAWFFKLQGDPELAGRESENFARFVTSVEFSNAAHSKE